MITRVLNWRKRGQGVLNGHISVEQLPDGQWKATSMEKSATAKEYQDAIGDVKQQLMAEHLDNRLNRTPALTSPESDTK